MSTTRIEFLETILQADAESVPILIELGWLYELERHDFDAAISRLNAALARDPESVEARFWLAKVYYHDGDQLEEAKDALEQALQFNPKHVPSLSLLAEIHLEPENSETTIRLLQRALELEPSWVALHAGADSAYTWQGNMAMAVRHAKEALRLAELFHKVSTPQTYTYYEAVVTGRWVTEDDLGRLRLRVCRKV